MAFRTQKGILHCFHGEVGSWCPLLSSQVGLLLISFDFMRRVSSSIGLTAPDHIILPICTFCPVYDFKLIISGSDKIDYLRSLVDCKNKHTDSYLMTKED